MSKNGLTRKTALISKVTPQSGKQTIAITYCPISDEVKAIKQ